MKKEEEKKQEESFQLDLFSEVEPPKAQDPKAQNQIPITKQSPSAKKPKKEEKPTSSTGKKALILVSIACIVVGLCIFLLNDGFDGFTDKMLDNDKVYEKLSSAEDRKAAKEVTKKMVKSSLKKALNGSLNEKELLKDIENQVKTLEAANSSEKKKKPGAVKALTSAGLVLSPAVPESAAESADSSEIKEPTFILGQNHYFTIPHALKGHFSFERKWTPVEEAEFLEGVNSSHPWKRWQTVRKVRQLHLSGSEVIFWQALGDDSFWTRMEALTGLAEFGLPVSLQIVENVLEDVKPRLVQNYIKRFWSKPSDGELFILRQSLSLVAEKSRLRILKILLRYAPKEHELYFVAALHDHAPEIRKFATKTIKHWPHEKLDSLNKEVDTFFQSKHLGLKGVGYPQEFLELGAHKKGKNEVGISHLQFYDNANKKPVTGSP